MDSALVVAVVTVTGGIIVALIQTGRRDNKTDHATVASGIERIEQKIDTHLIDHTRATMRTD